MGILDYLSQLSYRLDNQPAADAAQQAFGGTLGGLGAGAPYAYQQLGSLSPEIRNNAIARLQSLQITPEQRQALDLAGAQQANIEQRTRFEAERQPLDILQSQLGIGSEAQRQALFPGQFALQGQALQQGQQALKEGTLRLQEATLAHDLQLAGLGDDAALNRLPPALRQAYRGAAGGGASGLNALPGPVRNQVFGFGTGQPVQPGFEARPNPVTGQLEQVPLPNTDTWNTRSKELEYNDEILRNTNALIDQMGKAGPTGTQYFGPHARDMSLLRESIVGAFRKREELNGRVWSPQAQDLLDSVLPDPTNFGRNIMGMAGGSLGWGVTAAQAATGGIGRSLGYQPGNEPWPLTPGRQKETLKAAYVRFLSQTLDEQALAKRKYWYLPAAQDRPGAPVR